MTTRTTQAASADPGAPDRDLARTLDGLAAAVLGGAGTDRLVGRLSGLLGLPVTLLDAGLR
ncbi:MAG: hypothetical protein M3235_16665, partial [Actinomycetota bacterium]|nr:hypothetical protein [Actinomycetota bacterium]